MAFDEKELRKFTEAGRVIAAAAGTSIEVWARSEAGVILKTWAGRTKVSKERAVTVSAIMRAYRHARRLAGYGNNLNKGATGPGEASINLGIRHGDDGKVYYRTRKAGLAGGRRGFQDVFGPGFSTGKRIADQDWPMVNRMVQQFRREVSDLIAAAKKSVGLARQSIVQIADDIGIRLEDVKGGGTLSVAGITKARNAIASTGTYHRNGYSLMRKTAEDFSLTLVNRYPKMAPIFMDRTLQGVIAGRLGFFRNNLAEGTFLAVERVAKAYPYLAVLKAAA